MQSVKIMVGDDGQMMAKPCDCTAEDMEGATPVASMEELMQALPGMLKESEAMAGEGGEYGEGEKPAPMMEGEEEFLAGFKEAGGTPL